MPAMAAVHARPAVIEMLQQHQAALEPHHGLPRHELHQRGNALRRRPLARSDAEAFPLLLGQVYAPHPVVLDDVAQHVGELQGHTQVVGHVLDRPGFGGAVPAPASPGGGPGAEDAEGEPPHRAGHQAAVAHGVVHGCVGLAPHVHLAALDDLVQGSHRNRVAGGGVSDRDQHRIGGIGDLAGLEGLDERCGGRSAR